MDTPSGRENWIKMGEDKVLGLWWRQYNSPPTVEHHHPKRDRVTLVNIATIQHLPLEGL